MSKKYVLKVRVGQDYYPVRWPSGQICWPEIQRMTPTILTDKQAREIRLELLESEYLLSTDYSIEEYRPDQTLKLVGFE